MTAFDSLWSAIGDVGRDPRSGGFRRFAWNDAEMTLREWFVGCAAARGMDTERDRNGNLWAWWLPEGWTGDPANAFVTGSHLDSVPDGGAFDGPLGVVSAFAAVDALRAEGVRPRVPVGVVAFSDEEGARFGVACVGSQLSTGALDPDRARALRDIDGRSLAEVLSGAGVDPAALGRDERLAARVGVFVELHVEQGRALDRLGRPVAVASSIWPHGRWRLTFRGEANHAGATRMTDRHDPMLPYAATVAAARARAVEHDAVATFGRVHVMPNGANAIAVRGDRDARRPCAVRGRAGRTDRRTVRGRGSARRGGGHRVRDGGRVGVPLGGLPGRTPRPDPRRGRRPAGAVDGGRARRRGALHHRPDGDAVRPQPDRCRRTRRTSGPSATTA